MVIDLYICGLKLNEWRSKTDIKWVKLTLRTFIYGMEVVANCINAYVYDLFIRICYLMY